MYYIKKINPLEKLLEICILFMYVNFILLYNCLKFFKVSFVTETRNGRNYAMQFRQTFRSANWRFAWLANF